MKYLITGASGYIGKCLASSFNADDVCLSQRGCVDSSKSSVYLDLDEKVFDAAIFENVSCVFHIAGLAHNRARSKEELFRVNCDATIQLAKLAASCGVKRFIFMSSALVSCTELHAEMLVEPELNDFARSKYEAELGLDKVSKDTSMELVIIRAPMVYGPDAPGNFALLSKLVAKSPFLPFGLVTNTRSFVAIRNLVSLLKLCSEHPNAPGHVFMAADSVPVSTKNFTNAIAEGIGKNTVQLPIPPSVISFVAKIIRKPSLYQSLFSDFKVDSVNAHKILGWKPPYTMKQAMYSLLDITK